MLVWAGADPLMTVPRSMYDDWNFSYGEIPAQKACCGDNPEMIKVLRLNPSLAEAKSLLEYAIHIGSKEVLKELLRALQKEQLDAILKPHCEELNYFIEGEFYLFRYESYVPEEKILKRIAKLEVLLEAGAQWNPPKEKYNRLHKSFLKQPHHYIIRVIRMLLYVPNAVDRNVVREFCDTAAIELIIKDTDKPLYKEMKEMEQKG